MNNNCSGDTIRFEKRTITYVKPESVEFAIRNAVPGEKVLYHTGFLPEETRHTLYMKPENQALKKLQGHLQAEYDAGNIDLIQRKVVDYVYEYFAIRTRPPRVVRDYFFPTMYGIAQGSAGQVH